MKIGHSIDVMKDLWGALEAGRELKQATKVKWAGLAVTGISLAMTTLAGVAFSQGWIGAEVEPQVIYELSSTLVALVLAALGLVQVTTTPRIGVKPRGGSGQQRLHDPSVSTGADQPKQPADYPAGPFLDP